MVYFMRGEVTGRIRISSCLNSKSIENVKNELSEDVTILAIINEYTEGRAVIHNKFKESRIIGDWFEPTEELLEFIKNVSTFKLKDHDRVERREMRFKSKLFSRPVEKETKRDSAMDNLLKSLGER